MGSDSSVHRRIVRLHACMLTIATGSDEKASIAMALGLDRKDTARAGAAVAYENVLIAKELSLFICLVFLTQVRDAMREARLRCGLKFALYVGSGCVCCREPPQPHRGTDIEQEALTGSGSYDAISARRRPSVTPIRPEVSPIYRTGDAFEVLGTRGTLYSPSLASSRLELNITNDVYVKGLI